MTTTFKARIAAAIAAFATLAGGQATAAQQCSVIVMNELLPYRVSSGTDNGVNQALASLGSSYYAAVSEGLGDAASDAQDPKIKGLLTAGSAASNGTSAMLAALPGLIGAIDEARDDADDLYMSLSTERGHEAAFFPAVGEYTDRFSPGVPAGLEGVSGRVVPYVFGVDPNRDSISVTLFDHDKGSRDDIIGNFVFSQADAGKGKLTALSISEKHGGVIYAVQYEIVPVTCNPVMTAVLQAQYQGIGFSTLDAAEIATRMSVGMLEFLKPELAQRGIRF